MKAKTIKGNSPEEIAKQIRECTTQEFNPTLAIVFMPETQDSEKMGAIMDEKEILFFGVTSDLEFIDGEIGQDTIAVMLLDINPAYFKVAFREGGIIPHKKFHGKLELKAKRLLPILHLLLLQQEFMPIVKKFWLV
jgi:hypothetical protein